MFWRALVVVALSATVAAQPVTRVVDGDTLVVAGVGTVRLIGVDTPESVDPRRPVEALGKEAAEFLRSLVNGQTVRLEYEGQRQDRYGRTLAYVYLPDGALVNREIIRQGFGHAYLEFPFSKSDDFRAAQREAMTGQRGLWNGYTPTTLEPLPRCQALTREGDQCKRNAIANAPHCWQHVEQ